MAGVWDAEIKLLYAADAGAFFATNSVANGADFEVVANLEVGQNLMQVIDDGELYVSVRNLTQSSILTPPGKITQKVLLTAQNGPEENREEKVLISGSTSENGDELEVVCDFKAVAGVNTDVSIARTQSFVVE